MKLRPLFGRYGVESGHHGLVMSISAFDPTRTSVSRQTDDQFDTLQSGREI